MNRLLLFISFIWLTFPQICLAQDSDSNTKKIRDLAWEIGPQSLNAVGPATVYVPTGVMLLPPIEAKKFNDLAQNLPSETDTNVIAPIDYSWVAYFEFEALGYVKDDEDINPDELLRALKASQDQNNKDRLARGWSKIEIIGWQEAPHYDPKTKRLVWSTILTSDDETWINYHQKILGRRGVTTVTLAADNQNLTNSVLSLNNIIASYEFSSGNTYAEYNSGDKIAAYGLGALIVGGGIAAAAKSKGFLKIVGFLFIAIFGGLWTFIKRLFSK